MTKPSDVPTARNKGIKIADRFSARPKLAVGCLLVLTLTTACTPKPAVETTICRKFSFVASNKADVFEAKKYFYEGALHYGVGFADDVRWGGPATIEFSFGGKVYLTGYDTWHPINSETPRELTVTWADEMTTQERNTSVPCSNGLEQAAFEKIRQGFEQRWKLTKSIESPYVLKTSPR